MFSFTRCKNEHIGQEPIEKRTVVNIRLLTENSKKKIDRKQPRTNDYEATVVEPAPDSDFSEYTNNTTFHQDKTTHTLSYKTTHKNTTVQEKTIV